MNTVDGSASEVMGNIAKFGTVYQGTVGYEQLDGKNATGALTYVLGQAVKYTPDDTLITAPETTMTQKRHTMMASKRSRVSRR
jgi:hypothetical protein